MKRDKRHEIGLLMKSSKWAYLSKKFTDLQLLSFCFQILKIYWQPPFVTALCLNKNIIPEAAILRCYSFNFTEELVLFIIEKNFSILLTSWSKDNRSFTLQAPPPQNGQTRSKNPSATSRWTIWVCLSV